MVRRKPEGAPTKDEKRAVKALLSKGWRNQDIQALVNSGRPTTIDSARITEVRKDQKQKAASDDEVAFCEIKKRSFDPGTGLNLFNDERLIRAREAMILAVQIFNSAAPDFKTEVFSVLTNIARTYLLHEHHSRNGVDIVRKDDHSLPLSQMIERPDCPISEGARNTLRVLKRIRDNVEHKLLGKGDAKWFGLFQACCLNFDKTLRELFGERLTLANELTFALQFSRMDMEQLATANKYEIPAYIEALDARLSAEMSEEQLADLEYQFRVIYTLDAASKSKAHFEFVRPESSEAKEIRNILVRYKTADHPYPYKPGQICKRVQERTGARFTSHDHTQAWRLHEVRPSSGAKQPENTKKEFCVYHAAHGDYTYSERWLEHLVGEVSDDQLFAKIKAVKVR